jgi:hypothetical protein
LRLSRPSTILTSQLYNPGGIAHRDRSGERVRDGYSAGADNRALADVYTRAYECVGADPSIRANRDWRFNERKIWFRVIMSARAQVSMLRHRSSHSDCHHPEIVNPCSVADCSGFPDVEVPRYFYRDSRVDVDMVSNSRAEESEHAAT